METMNEGNVSVVLEVAIKAGRLLIENGAEISRVEDIMERIAAHYGVDTADFYVLSNGLFTSGTSHEKDGSTPRIYAKVLTVPIRSMQFAKVIEVNRLSYSIASGKYTLEEADRELDRIRNLPAQPILERILVSAFGTGTFGAVFGGGFLECASCFVVGLLSAIFSIFISSRYLSRIVATIFDAVVMSLLCIVFYRIGFGRSLSNLMIGAVMLLVPGLAFVNGVRDLANSDYLAGLTRMTDAMLSFLCISIGVTCGFMLDGSLSGGIISISGIIVDPSTAGYGWQALAAAVATLCFGSLFGVPRNQYLTCGVIGGVGWVVYLVAIRILGTNVPVAAVMSSFSICVMSRLAAVRSKSPATIFLLCGLFPLVPGAGIFWCTYYLTTSQLVPGLTAGFNAIQVAISIVLGIVLAMELPQRMFSRAPLLRHRRSN